MKTMTILFRSLMTAVASLALALGWGTSFAQDKPTVKILVGFPSGGGADALARIYAEALNQTLNVNAVVENKPGAGGHIANQALKQATPESNTLMLTMDHQVVMVPLITRNLGYDVRKDFIPVARIMSFNTCLATSTASPHTTLQAHIEAIRSKPELGNYGVPAPGSQAHFVGYVVGKHFKVNMTAVPYRGAAPAVADLLGNQIASLVMPCDAFYEHRKNGKVRVLGVAADQRIAALPDVPTFDEMGVKMPTDNFVAVYASSSLKPELLRQLNEATQQIFRNPRYIERFAATGMTVSYAPGDELRKIVDRGAAFWAEQVKATNFQVD